MINEYNMTCTMDVGKDIYIVYKIPFRLLFWSRKRANKVARSGKIKIILYQSQVCFEYKGSGMKYFGHLPKDDILLYKRKENNIEEIPEINCSGDNYEQLDWSLGKLYTYFSEKYESDTQNKNNEKGFSFMYSAHKAEIIEEKIPCIIRLIGEMAEDLWDFLTFNDHGSVLAPGAMFIILFVLVVLGIKFKLKFIFNFIRHLFI